MGSGKDAKQSSSSGKCKSKVQWDITSHPSEWLSPKRAKITNVCDDVKERDPLCTLVGKVNLRSHSGKQNVGFFKN